MNSKLIKIYFSLIFLSFFSVCAQESLVAKWYKNEVMLKKADSIASDKIKSLKLDTIMKGDYSHEILFKDITNLKERIYIYPVTIDYKNRMKRKLIRYGYCSDSIFLADENNVKNGSCFYFDRNKITALEIYKDNKLTLRYSLTNKKIESKIIQIYSENDSLIKRLGYSFNKGKMQYIAIYDLIEINECESITLFYDDVKLQKLQYFFSYNAIIKAQKQYPNSLFVTLIGFEINYNPQGEGQSFILYNGTEYKPIIVPPYISTKQVN